MRTCSLLACVVGLSWGVVLSAAADEPLQGSLQIGGKTYALKHAVAYETTLDDEPRLSVLLSDRKISVDKIKAALREEEGSDESLHLSQPYVRLVFLKSGELDDCSIWADNTSFAGGGDRLQGDMKLADGRIQGKAKLHYVDPLDMVTSFDVQFALALGLDAPAPTPTAPTSPAKPTVTGTFVGNKQPAKLAFVSAHRGEPFNDEPSIVLVFTEKDHSRDNKPDFKAGFGDYGSAVILSVKEDGSIFGCQIAHAAHEKSGFSSIGSVRSADFQLGPDRIAGHFTTDGEKTTFDETWSLDIKFVVPFASAPPAKTAAKTPDKPQATGRTTPKPDSTPAAQPKPSPGKPADASAAVNVRDLPFPDDAQVEYKQLVEQIVFTSGSSVQDLAGKFSKELAAQGWKSKGADLITPNSAILNLIRGDATLTVMVKPSGNGSRTTIFTKGLNWKQ